MSEKKIAILGFAFKSNTNDTRESAAIQICQDLLDEGARLYIHDPKVSPEQISKDLNMAYSNNNLDEQNKRKLINEEGCWHSSKNLLEVFEGADAAVILTEWIEYSNINWDEASSLMRSPAWVFDARSIVNPDEVKKLN